MVYFTVGRKDKDGKEIAKSTFPDGSYLIEEWDRGKAYNPRTEIHNSDGSIIDELDPTDNERNSNAFHTKTAWDDEYYFAMANTN